METGRCYPITHQVSQHRAHITVAGLGGLRREPRTAVEATSEDWKCPVDDLTILIVTTLVALIDWLEQLPAWEGALMDIRKLHGTFRQTIPSVTDKSAIITTYIPSSSAPLSRSGTVSPA
jgi:hypothetical protein